jgi:hypothetical protein
MPRSCASPSLRPSLPASHWQLSDWRTRRHETVSEEGQTPPCAPMHTHRAIQATPRDCRRGITGPSRAVAVMARWEVRSQIMPICASVITRMLKGSQRWLPEAPGREPKRLTLVPPCSPRRSAHHVPPRLCGRCEPHAQPDSGPALHLDTWRSVEWPHTRSCSRHQTRPHIVDAHPGVVTTLQPHGD